MIFRISRVAKEAHDAWSVEINRLATRLEDLDPEAAGKEITRMLHAEVAPRLIEYKK